MTLDEADRAQAAAGVPVPTARQRLLAVLAFLAAGAAVLAVLMGFRGGLVVVAVGVLGLALVLAGAWLFLGHRGLTRWFGAALVVASIVGVLAFYVAADRLLDIAVALLFIGVAVWAARSAMPQPPSGMSGVRTPAPTRPFLIMNPRSGGGKVGRFDLVTKAEERGATVSLLEGAEHIDVAELARAAVADGADLLGVAGGDGTQALVAGIAAEAGLPFLVISAGTRNHFAMDLGLDRERPDAGLDALTDGVELEIDLGDIGGRIFVNNASFGAYADIVESPLYRDNKRGTTLQMLPDVLTGHQGPRLLVHVDGEVIEAPHALLVSNNPYDFTSLGGIGRRTVLDTGRLGVLAVTVDSAAQAAGLVRGRRSKGMRGLTAHEVVVDADVAEIPVGIDGESVMMPTPVRCTIRPRALRVRVPVDRPGVSMPRSPVDVGLLWHQAVARHHS